MHVLINVKSPNNISKWQIGFNSAFKGLTHGNTTTTTTTTTTSTINSCDSETDNSHLFSATRFDFN
jgi:hypothetical protein